MSSPPQLLPPPSPAEPHPSITWSSPPAPDGSYRPGPHLATPPPAPATAPVPWSPASRCPRPSHPHPHPSYTHSVASPVLSIHNKRPARPQRLIWPSLTFRPPLLPRLVLRALWGFSSLGHVDTHSSFLSQHGSPWTMWPPTPHPKAPTLPCTHSITCHHSHHLSL